MAWPLFALWPSGHSTTKLDATGLDFPFDRPYLGLYNRCIITLRAIDAVRKLRRRAALFDERRDKLRLASKLPENESEDDLNIMRKNFDKWIAEIKKRRPSPKRGPSEDIRNAIDTILKHVDTHGDNLWGHIIPLPEYADRGILLIVRTNEQAENFFKKMKHSERRRSGRKNLTQDLEHLPAAAALAYNLKGAFAFSDR